MQIRQRIFKCSDVQVLHFFLDKIFKLLTLRTFLPLIIARLSTVKNSLVFLAHSVKSTCPATYETHSHQVECDSDQNTCTNKLQSFLAEPVP